MHHPRLFVTVAALVGVVSIASPTRAHDEAEVWRLFVADHTAPRITVMDLAKPAHRWTFDVKGPARLYASPSGGTIVATQGDNDAVSFLSSGVTIESHGDHADIEVEDPSIVAPPLEGPRPAHVVFHDGTVAVTFDRGGYADILTEAALREGRFEATRFPQARAHHGFAVPVGDVVVSSVASDAPVDADKLPPRVGIQSFTPAGEPIGDMTPCTDLHGEAFSGRFLVAGCKEGVVAVEETGEGLRFAMMPYPDEFPDGHTGTLLGSKAMQMFLGNYGADAVVVIDPANAPHFTRIELPFRRVDFVLDPAHPADAFVLTEDGTLHRLDMIGAEIEASGRVTEPYSMDGHWRDPRPRLAVAGERVVVTDPTKGVVRLVDRETLAEVEAIAVEGIPYSVVAVGGSGQAHEGEVAHGHDHGDDAIYRGYFEDSQIADRPLSDWAGDWQSVYRHLQDGTLDPVMAHKADGGTMSAEEYKAYYEVGYRTDVDRITIEGDTVTFHRDGEATAGRYVYDGREILTYEKGNRGVRFIFRKTEGDEGAPQFIQFSDHKIAPARADHYHLYWGDDRAALLEELTNWPTYYPSSLAAEEIVAEMMAH